MCVHPCAHTHTRVSMSTCSRVCMCMSVRVNTRASIYTHARVFIRAHLCACMCPCKIFSETSCFPCIKIMASLILIFARPCIQVIWRMCHEGNVNRLGASFPCRGGRLLIGPEELCLNPNTRDQPCVQFLSQPLDRLPQLIEIPLAPSLRSHPRNCQLPLSSLIMQN